jgi:2'-5' RNA ligase
VRLFAAVQPPPDVLAHLEHALDAVRGPVEDAGGAGPLRWAPSDDRHVTLAFFGEVPAGSALEVEQGLARIAGEHDPFRARLRGAGVFDRRVFWIGVGGDVDELAALTADCVDLGTEVTGRTDSRVRSRAHLTVARVRSQARTRARPYPRRGTGSADGTGRTTRTDRPGRRADAGELGGDPVAGLAHALAVYAGPEWTVDRFALLSSRPGEGRGGGPLYSVEATYALGGPAGGVPGGMREPLEDERP